MIIIIKPVNNFFCSIPGTLGSVLYFSLSLSFLTIYLFTYVVTLSKLIHHPIKEENLPLQTNKLQRLFHVLYEC